MTPELREKLIKITREEMQKRQNDVSHDFNHALNVLHNAETIAASEGGDPKIIIPAALFHDIVIYPKNHPRSDEAPYESAALAREILSQLAEYTPEDIEKVVYIIGNCSWSKTSEPTSLEQQIIRDADKLAATGAISIMRTFASSGLMNRPLYNLEDPFAENRELDAKSYALDLFKTRLLEVPNRLHTQKAKEMAQSRHNFLLQFLTQLETEI